MSYSFCLPYQLSSDRMGRLPGRARCTVFSVGVMSFSLPVLTAHAMSYPPTQPPPAREPVPTAEAAPGCPPGQVCGGSLPNQPPGATNGLPAGQTPTTPPAEDLASRLRTRLDSPQPSERQRAIRTVVYRRVTELEPRIAELAATDDIPGVRIEAVYALGEMNIKAHEALLLRIAMFDSDAALKDAANKVLRHHGLGVEPAPVAQPVSAEPVATAYTGSDPVGPGVTASSEPEELKEQLTPASFQRLGAALDLGAGLRLCIRDMCEAKRNDLGDVKPGLPMALGFSYRFLPWLSLGAEGWFAIHRARTGGEAEELEEEFSDGGSADLKAFSWGAAIMARAHPVVGNKRVDPIIGLGLGMNWDKLKFEADYSYVDDGEDYSFELEHSETLRRWLMRAEVGLDIYVSPRVSLGPRIRLDIPFAGERCTYFEAVEDGDVEESEEECDDVDRRFTNDQEDELPIWLAFDFTARFRF